MDKFEKRIEKIENLPEAQRLRENIKRSINAYRRFLEGFGLEASVSVGPMSPADSGEVVRWHEINPLRH